MKRKLGINIDGVIRNFLERFEKVYISTYIHNETLVESGEDGGMKVLTDQEEEARAAAIEGGGSTPGGERSRGSVRGGTRGGGRQ